MDKETLSNYGWIVICVLILAVMIALATPFGSFVATAVKSTTVGLFDVNQKALNSTGLVNVPDQDFIIPGVDEENVGGAPEDELDLTKVNPVLAENDWATIQKVIQAGKAEEAGWKVGDISPEFEANGNVVTATIIGIDHDGENTITFMFKCHDYIDMNGNGSNAGGWQHSDLRGWLSTEVFPTMTISDYIIGVDKSTCNDGSSITTTNDKLFMISAKEAGLSCPSYYSAYSNLFDAEGTTYELFESKPWTFTWTRTACFDTDYEVFYYYGGSCYAFSTDETDTARAAFVIG